MVALLRLSMLHGDGLLLLHLRRLAMLCLLRVGLSLGLKRLLLGMRYGCCLLGIARLLLLLLLHGLLLLHLLTQVWRELDKRLSHVLLQRGHLLGAHVAHLVWEAHLHTVLLREHLLLLLLLSHEGRLLLSISVLLHERRLVD